MASPTTVFECYLSGNGNIDTGVMKVLQHAKRTSIYGEKSEPNFLPGIFILTSTVRLFLFVVFQAGTIISPQFLNTTMPPTKRPNAHVILMFPEILSGAKTSVRRNLFKVIHDAPQGKSKRHVTYLEKPVSLGSCNPICGG